jgi:hypothetical protein
MKVLAAVFSPVIRGIKRVILTDGMLLDASKLLARFHNLLPLTFRLGYD